MKVAMDCQLIQDLLRDYVEGVLPKEERAPIARHLASCPRCGEAYRRRKELVGLMSNTLGKMRIGEEFDARASQRLSDIDQHLDQLRTPGGGQETLPSEEVSVDEVPRPWDEAEAEDEMPPGGEEEEVLPERRGSLFDHLGGVPWWLLSGAFHALLLLLLTLIGMAVLRAKSKDIVVMTDLKQAPEKPPEEKKVKRDIFKKTAIADVEMPTVSEQVVTHEEVEIADYNETPDDSEMNDSKGAEDAISDVPLGGIGSVAAVGLGGGRSGAFGRPTGSGGRLRRAMRFGGGRKTESAVDKGLEWLARNQEPDGRWDNAKHGGKHDGVKGDAAMTGYALLAFLGAGHTEKVGKYRENVRRAVKWLIENMGKNQGRRGHEGRWVPLNYTQGIASMGLAEAAAMARNPSTKEAAQKAVDGVEFGQIKRGGDSDREAWDYGPRPNGGTNDSSIMAWNVLALKSAKVGGLKVNPAAFEGALTWINAGQDLGPYKPGQEATESDWEGGRMAYRGTPADPKKGKGSYAVMAAAALCRMYIGGAKHDDAGVLGPANIIKKKLCPKKYPFNLYFGYYATLVMFQMGGEHWKAWNESALKKVLVEAQRKGGVEDGSWDGMGATDKGSRVMSTALAILCLEVYYRYLPLYKQD